MSLTSALTPAGGKLGTRFLLVSYLPTLASATFLLALVWAGAPGADMDAARTWRTASKLGAGELILLWLAVTLVAVAGHPLQLWLVRLVEGHWPNVLKPLAALGSQLQETRRSRLARESVIQGTPSGQAEINRAGAAESELRLRYPPLDLPAMPTALGNVLSAMEFSAGSAYGLDAVVAWPRLYPLLSAETKAVVDDRRDLMDAGCRLAVMAACTAVITAGLAWRAGGLWLLLVPALLILARIAYRGAVQSALAYATAVTAAIDLHRFALYEKLHLPFPADPNAEKRLNLRLSLHWRQNHPHPAIGYRRPPDTTPPADPPRAGI